MFMVELALCDHGNASHGDQNLDISDQLITPSRCGSGRRPAGFGYLVEKSREVETED